MTAWRAAMLLVLLVAAVACRREEPLPEYGQVPSFALRDQEGRAFSEASLRGQVSVVAFMFTRCPTVCPAVTRAMKTLQDDAKKKGVRLRLVSVSVDPDNDSPEVLRRYAEQYGADLSTWSFVTGDQATVQRTAEQGFKIAVAGSADPSKEHFGITHGTHLVLVGPDLGIRGYYRTSDPAERSRLMEDAARLSPR